MMLGIKNKFKRLVRSVVDEYLREQSPKVEAKEESIADIDISMAEAEQKKKQNSLVENLKLSFQRDFSDLKYTKGKKQYAIDSLKDCVVKNNVVGLTGSPKDIVFTFFSKFGYIGWQICSVLGQHWLISNACSISNSDCLRNGWSNLYYDKKENEDDEKGQEKLNKLYEIGQQKYKLTEKLLKWGYYRNLFGTAYLLPKIDGIDYEQPYNADGIKKGSFKGLAIIEPYWAIPEFDLENMMNPTDVDFMEPEYYRTQDGLKIHKSHLIIGRRKFVSDILKPSYYFGGISLAQEIYERVYASEKCANESPLLLLTKRLNVYKTKLKNVFANPQHYKELMEVITEMRDNQGILFADMDDDIGQIDTGLGDLEPVIMGQYQLVSAIARIPADKLFETNPTGGLSASGDYNIKNYNQDLNTLQNDVFKPAIDRINEIIMRSDLDSKDRITILFNPTDNPTEREIAELNSQKANTLNTYLQANIITTEEARQKLINDKMSGFSFLKDSTKNDKQEKEDMAEVEKMMKKAKEDKKEAKDEDDTDWITVKGNHIPIEEGESKEEAVKKFIDSKKNSNEKKEYFGSEEHKKLREQGKKAGLTEEEMNKLDDINKKISNKNEKTVEKSTKKEYNKSSVEYEKSVSSKDFYSSLKKAKQTIPENARWRVDDTHKIEDYEHCKRFKTKNGSVVAVTDDNDIISVCKNGNSSDRGSQLLEKAVQEGGNKLDAFGEVLYKFYTKNGFEPVSWCNFNREYAPHDWNDTFVEEPVIFYKYIGKDKQNKYKDYNEFISKVKASEDYDTAMKKRNKSMK